jgi:hypothetical protein
MSDTELVSALKAKNDFFQVPGHVLITLKSIDPVNHVATVEAESLWYMAVEPSTIWLCSAGAVSTFSISFSSEAVLVDFTIAPPLPNSVLDVTSLPPGGGTVSLTVSSQSPAAPGFYDVEVQVTDIFGFVQSRSSTFIYTTSPPSKPVPLVPAENTIIAPASSFTWATAPGAGLAVHTLEVRVKPPLLF